MHAMHDHSRHRVPATQGVDLGLWCGRSIMCRGHSATDHRVGLGNHPQCRDDHDPDRDTEVRRIGHQHNEDQNDCGQPGQKDRPTVRAEQQVRPRPGLVNTGTVEGGARFRPEPPPLPRSGWRQVGCRRRAQHT